MGIKTMIYNKGKTYLEKRHHQSMLQNEYRKYEDPRRVAIYSSVLLSTEQKEQIDDLFINHYGKRISYIWHRHFTAFTGRFDPCYIPEPLFIPEFEYYMNSNKSYINVFADKNVLSMIAQGVGVKMPETIISCANGMLRNSKYQKIGWEDIRRIMPTTSCFAKPTIDSDSGRGCMLVERKQDNLIEELKKLGTDFVVQEKIECSKSIKTIYPKSVNTFRVMTYQWKGEIQCAPVIMRIGRGGSYLDNAHAGGIFIAVNKNGTLHKTAFTEFKEEFDEQQDTHLVFDGYKIENFEKVILCAKKMHTALPQLGVINWDFTIDNNEEPVLIEANTSGGSIWLFQMAWGCGVFENNTIEVLEWLKEKNAHK